MIGTSETFEFSSGTWTKMYFLFQDKFFDPISNVECNVRSKSELKGVEQFVALLN